MQEIEIRCLSNVSEATEDLVVELNELLAQLEDERQPLTVEWLREVVSHPACDLFIASMGGKVVGTVSLVVGPPTILRRENSFVAETVTHRDYRRYGVGRKLMQAFDEAVVRRGLKRVISLTAPWPEEANAFYAKLGYVQVGKSNVYVKEYGG